MTAHLPSSPGSKNRLCALQVSRCRAPTSTPDPTNRGHSSHSAAAPAASNTGQPERPSGRVSQWATSNSDENVAEQAGPETAASRSKQPRDQVRRRLLLGQGKQEPPSVWRRARRAEPKGAWPPSVAWRVRGRGFGHDAVGVIRGSATTALASSAWGDAPGSDGLHDPDPSVRSGLDLNRRQATGGPVVTRSRRHEREYH